jgi:hypothetical protein
LGGRIMRKTGITWGGQIVVISDVSQQRAYVHWHKIHKWLKGFVEGPNEIRLIVAQILLLIESQVSDSRHQIWKIMPHLHWDNYLLKSCSNAASSAWWISISLRFKPSASSKHGHR